MDCKNAESLLISNEEAEAILSEIARSKTMRFKSVCSVCHNEREMGDLFVLDDKRIVCRFCMETQ